MVVDVMFSTRRLRTAAVAALACIAGPAMAQQPSLIPDRAVLHPAAQTAIDAQWLTDEERKDLRVFHGVWDDRDIDSPTRRAAVTLNAGDFDDAALSDPSVPVELRAEALLGRGDLDNAIRLLEMRTIGAFDSVRGPIGVTVGVGDARLEMTRISSSPDDPAVFAPSVEMQTVSLSSAIGAELKRSRLCRAADWPANRLLRGAIVFVAAFTVTSIRSSLPLAHATSVDVATTALSCAARTGSDAFALPSK